MTLDTEARDWMAAHPEYTLDSSGRLAARDELCRCMVDGPHGPEEVCLDCTSTIAPDPDWPRCTAHDLDHSPRFDHYYPEES